MLHRSLLVPVTVLAVAITEEMARWCARPYRYDHLGSTFRPLVIGPSVIPRIIDVEQASALPELALLSVAAHGQEAGAEAIGIAAYLAAGTLDTDRGARYVDIIMAWLSDAARRAVEKHMSLRKALIKAIEGLTTVLGITLSPKQRETLENAGVDRLDAIHEALCSSRRWPSD